MNRLVCHTCCVTGKIVPVRDGVCPNCGGILERQLWGMGEIIAYDPKLEMSDYNGAFQSVGSLLSDEPMLLSYAMDATFLIDAVLKKNVSIIYARREDVDALKLEPLEPPNGQWPTFIYSENPQVDFFEFHNYLVSSTDFYGDEFKSRMYLQDVQKWHEIGGFGSDIASLSVMIGANAKFDNTVCIMTGVIIGERVTICPNVVIGVEGARLIKNPDGTFFRARHGGSVEIGDDVFIGANAVIVKSMWWRPTKIGDRAFIGNLVNVGHNVTVHNDATILPGAILCGRCVVMPGATVGPGAIISNGVTIGRDAWVTLGAVVTKDVPDGARMSGNFAVDHQEQIAHVKRLASGRHRDDMPEVR
jgi:acetyltransferase-like isoleucine patch superfamily enzyme